MTTELKKVLGANSSIEIYPALGNHDLYPANEQDFSKGPNNDDTLNELKKLWTDDRWLNEDQSKQFAKYGFYSKPLINNPAGRVIVLNNQACYSLNFAIYNTHEDPGHELAWFERELADLESKNGFAYLISHVPSNDCLEQYSRRL